MSSPPEPVAIVSEPVYAEALIVSLPAPPSNVEPNAAAAFVPRVILLVPPPTEKFSNWLIFSNAASTRVTESSARERVSSPAPPVTVSAEESSAQSHKLCHYRPLHQQKVNSRQIEL